MKTTSKPTLIIFAIALILIGTVGLVINKYTQGVTRDTLETEKEYTLLSTIDEPILLSGEMVEYVNEEYGFKILLPKEMNTYSDVSYDVFFKDELTYSLTFRLVKYDKDFILERLNLLMNANVGEKLEVSASSYDESTVFYEKLSTTEHGLTVYIEPRLMEADNKSSLQMIAQKENDYYVLELVLYGGDPYRDDLLELKPQRTLFENIVNSFELL